MRSFNAAVQARGKSFVFLGDKGATYLVRLRVKESLGDAEAWAADEPDVCEVGKFGWLKIVLPADRAPPEHIARWIDESFRLLAPKSLVKTVPPGGPPR